jgi:hypothetical protein
MPDIATENLLVEFFTIQFDSLNRTLEMWQRLEDSSSRSDWSEFISLHERLYEKDSDYTKGFERLVKDTSLDISVLQKERRVFETVLLGGSEICTRSWEFLDQIGKQTGRPIEGYNRLLDVAKKFEQRKAKVVDEWPVCSPEEEKQVWDEIRRGEGIELDEAFAQIAGVDRETWLNRVAEHQRKKQGNGQE